MENDNSYQLWVGVYVTANVSLQLFVRWLFPQSGVQHILYCVCVVLFYFCLTSSCVASFSGLSILDCPFCFLWIVHSWLSLLLSLDCPFLIAPSVFSGLSILDCPFCFLWIVHSWLPLRFSLQFISTIFHVYCGGQIYWWRKPDCLKNKLTCRMSLNNNIG